jgi:hypothetical protein
LSRFFHQRHIHDDTLYQIIHSFSLALLASIIGIFSYWMFGIPSSPDKKFDLTLFGVNIINKRKTLTYDIPSLPKHREHFEDYFDTVT